MIYENDLLDFRQTLKNYPELVEYFENYLVELNSDRPPISGGKRRRYKKRKSRRRKQKT